MVEFWNRYYYYFKEIMVEFFFYPTFIGWFRKWPRLRLFAAVYMAAFVGNMYYHLIGKEEKLAARGFSRPLGFIAYPVVLLLFAECGHLHLDAA